MGLQRTERAMKSPLSFKEASLVAFFLPAYCSAQMYVWVCEAIGHHDRLLYVFELSTLGAIGSAIFGISFAIFCTNNTAGNWLGTPKWD